MPSSIRRVSVVACLVSFGACVASAQSIMLKPKLVEGRVTYIELSDDVEQAISSVGNPEAANTSTARQVYGLISRVEAVKDGQARIGVTYDRIAINTTAPPPLDYDSDRKQQRDEAREVDPICRTMLGRSAIIEIGADGRATGVKKFQEIVDDAGRKASPGSLMSGMLSMMRPAMFQMQAWDKPHALYPNREVKVGEKWQTSIETTLPLTGPLKYAYDCTLKSVEKRDGRDMAIVEFTGAIAAARKGPPDRDGPLFLSIESGKIKGNAEFDIELGEFTRQIHETELGFSGTPWKPDGKLEDAPAVSLRQKSKSTIRVLSTEQREKQKRENAEASAAPQSQPAGR